MKILVSQNERGLFAAALLLLTDKQEELDTAVSVSTDYTNPLDRLEADSLDLVVPSYKSDLEVFLTDAVSGVVEVDPSILFHLSGAANFRYVSARRYEVASGVVDDLWFENNFEASVWYLLSLWLQDCAFEYSE